jgi:hypothetical protein
MYVDEAAAVAEFKIRMTTKSLVLKRAPIGDNPEDYSVLEDGVVVGRIFTVPTAPPGRPWMWASGHSAATVKRAAHGYEPTRPRWQRSRKVGGGRRSPEAALPTAYKDCN